ncbi:MAG TPA: ATP-binding cassette domain-containing protein [bacterium]|jgi:cell division transport system ATP-binding protein|nr:ATP-binding cassette domain-containing protein [bacterium]
MFIQGFHLTQTDASGMPILEDAYFSFPEGSYTVLLSENVFSTTAFLKMLAGEYHPVTGTLRVDHQDPYDLTESQKRRWLTDVGVIFSDFKLFSDRTVVENILFILRAKGFWDKDSLGAVNILLNKAGLGAKANLLPEALTEGERQLVMALRAMIFRPRLLLADDPFQGVEESAFKILFKFLSELNKSGTTIVISARQAAFLEEAKKLGESQSIRWMQLDGGQLYSLEEKVS